MTQQNLLELAKQGNVQAINVLLNRVFQLNGITAKTAIKDGCLHLLLESAQVPNQQTLVPAIRGAMMNLGVASVKTMVIYGRETGKQQPDWNQTIQLDSHLNGMATSIEATSPHEPLTEPHDVMPANSVAAALLSEPEVGSTNNSSLKEQIAPDEQVRPANAATYTVDEPTLPNHTASSETEAPGTAESIPLHMQLPTQELPVEAVALDDEVDLVNESATRGSKWTRNILLATLGLLVIGIIGLHTSVVSKQQQAIDEAQKLAASAGSASNATSINSLRTARQELQQAISLLEAVPDVPGSANRQAEEELARIRLQLDEVQQRLSNEELFQNNLQTAQQLAAQASQLTQKSPRSLATTQQAEAKFREAINLLAAIPDGTFVSSSAKQKLAVYRMNYITLSKQVQNVQKQLKQPQNKSRVQQKRK